MRCMRLKNLLGLGFWIVWSESISEKRLGQLESYAFFDDFGRILLLW